MNLSQKGNKIDMGGRRDGEGNRGTRSSLGRNRIDAQKVRPYDHVWDMYYDEFEDEVAE